MNQTSAKARLFPVRALVLAIGMAVFLWSCTREPVQELQPMIFNIDPTLLGEAVADEVLGIRFRPPLGWDALPDTLREALDRRTQIPGEGPRPELRYIFMHSAKNNVMSVSLLSMQNSVTFEEQMATYGRLLSHQYPGDSLHQEAFLKDGIPVMQFLLQPAGMVNFKLVFSLKDNTLLQVDYIVPQEQYAGQVKAIESSIGSIQRMY